MKRILFLINSDGIGGVERKVALLMDAFLAQGVSSDLVTLSSGPPSGGLLSDRPLRVLGSRLPAGPLRRISQLHALATILGAGGHDAVLAFGPSPNALACLARQPGVRAVICEPGNPFIPKRRRWNATIMRVYPRAHALVVPTTELRARLLATIACPPVVASIPNPVSPAVPVVGPSDARPHRIVTAGRLVSSKRVGDLLDAFAAVSPRFRDWELVVIGDGPERSALERQAARVGVADRVTFTGFLKAPWQALAESSIFVLASAHEGFANVLVEAAASGCAVVSSDCDFGPRQILGDGRLGALYPVGDIAALAGHLARLMADPALRTAMARQVQASLAPYSADAVAARWLELLMDSRTALDRGLGTTA